MSLPKEPRQKMINMMYLVLTALLALNVSVEVLNAFKTVNTSIENSNGVVDQKNSLTYKSFEESLKDPQTMAKAATWTPRAETVKKLSSDLTAYIETLKNKLIDESNPQMKDGKKEFTDGALDPATRIFDREGEGPVLYARLGKFKTDLLDVLDPSHYPDQPAVILEDLKATKESYAKQLPLSLEVPHSESGNASTGNVPKDWTINYFHMTPTIAALTILSKFQSDVKNSESQVIDYLHKKIGEVKVVYDKFQVLAQASSNYVMPGDELHITAGVGAFSDAAKPKITINGQPMTLKDGLADFGTKADGAGDHTVLVHVEFAKPDGSIEKKDMPVKYTVGLPSGASVFLEKMNVLYVGEENPLVISGGSVGREKVHVSFSGGNPVENQGGDKYIIKPTTPGEAKIIVNAAGKLNEFPMRVKFLPNPAGFVGTSKGGSISAAEFKADGGLLAHLENSDFISPFQVTSYKLSAIGGNIPQATQATNEGPRWNGRAADIVNRCSPGTNVFFDEIHVKGRDGRDRTLPPMVFILK